MLQKITSSLGLTSAVSWSIMTQAVRLLTGPVTLYLYVKYLDVETQGYVYTFASVIAASIFLEVGFSQNILQFASHEYAKLHLDKNKSLAGDDVALSRLISLGRLSLKYYSVAFACFLVLLIFGGEWFFATSQQVGVEWRIPWYITSAIASLSLLINPFWAMLEGCNQVAAVQKFRFYSSIAGVFSLAVGLMSGHGLYGVCLAALVPLLMSIVYLFYRWRNFFKSFFAAPTHGVISWRQEIWPFQWKIAVSWICGYFIFSGINPIVFRLEGAVAAAQIGFALQLTRVVATAAGSWSVTRLPEFGAKVALKDWDGLSRVWTKTTNINVFITLAGSILLIMACEVASRLWPSFQGRYAGIVVIGCFAVSIIVQAKINCYSYYLRSFKQEPYMYLSIFQAVTSSILVFWLTCVGGIEGTSVGYLISTLSVLPFAWKIFKEKSEEYKNGIA
jgi:O-antigen/teichoic acid export membrane protein